MLSPSADDGDAVRVFRRGDVLQRGDLIAIEQVRVLRADAGACDSGRRAAAVVDRHERAIGALLVRLHGGIDRRRDL
jgi:hypothetical protein